MLNLAISKKRQVDDFNTVVGPPSPVQPAQSRRTKEESQAAGGHRRPDSARSDPGVKGGSGGSGGGGGGGGDGDNSGENHREVLAQSPTPFATEEGSHAEQIPPQPLAAGSAEAEAEAPSEPAARAISVESLLSPTHPADRELLARSRLANTPTTPFTDIKRRGDDSRPSQQTATTLRHQRMYFEHAVSLVAARCATTDPRTGVQRRSAEVADPPPGFGGPRFLYVRQVRPRPMTPLKAWSGYHGNVYFSPLRIEQASYSDPDTQLSLPDLPACSDRLRRVLEGSRLNAEHLVRLRARATAAPRQPARRRWLAGGGGGGGQSADPVVELDRAVLVSRGGGSVADSRDVHLYRSAHDTGTLHFQRQLEHQMPHQPQHQSQPTSRVYRGSVSRKLRDLKLALAEPQRPRALSPVQKQQLLHHNTSLVSLEAEVDRLYDRLPTLMAGVPRSHAVRQQMRSGGGGGEEAGGR